MCDEKIDFFLLPSTGDNISTFLMLLLFLLSNFSECFHRLFSDFVIHVTNWLLMLQHLCFPHLYKCETDDSWVFLLNLLCLIMILLSFFVFVHSLASLWVWNDRFFLLRVFLHVRFVCCVFRYILIRHLLVLQCIPIFWCCYFCVL